MFKANVRRWVPGGFAAVALCVLGIMPARAIPVTTQILMDGPGAKVLKLETAEYLIGPLAPGGVVRGVLRVSLAENGFAPADPRPIGSGGVNELTALFELQLTDVICVGPLCTIRATWNDSFASDPALAGFTIPAGSHPTLALFEDATPDFDRSTIAAGEATATNGLPYMLLGMDGTDDFWLGQADFSVTEPGSVFGTFFRADTVLDNPRGPALAAMTCTTTIAGGASATADVCFSGKLILSASGEFPFGTESNAFMTTVPEPATWSLFGTGILGLLFARRQLSARPSVRS